MRTLLVGTATSSWKEWLREHLGDEDLILIHPADASHGFPARYVRLREGKVRDARFFGSLDPLRAPHVTVGTIARFSRNVSDALLLLGDLGRSPLARQTFEAVLDAYGPQKILAPVGGHPWCPAEEMELASSPAPAVHHAQRRAHWIDLLERSQRHELTTVGLRFEGTRLGTGEPLAIEGAIHAEKIGSTLYAIVEGEFDERAISIALDRTGANKAHFVQPETFRGLLCGLVRENGEEAGVGIIESFDLAGGTVVVRSPAVPPLPVAMLRIGALRLDREGNEVGELRPWAV
ncbi:hypothetical protein EON81_00690 [bacterium]|nr:MAG: hypothetical protein EON81_00690 [bacterium]